MQFTTLALSVLAAASAVTAGCIKCTTTGSVVSPYFVMSKNDETGYDLAATLKWTGVESTGTCSLVAKIEANHPRLITDGPVTVEAWEGKTKIGSFSYTKGEATNTVIGKFPCKSDFTFTFTPPASDGDANLAFTELSNSGIFLKAC
ncbi:hypothetical protein GGR57DRAFT_252932 [Xylariaceae sp. FL1272]|nr:hypothetical protein GGR57DRAFT_252932 [Xylariaceae sp. FL1272]